MPKVPFSAYDTFGYLATGLVALVGMELIAGFPKILDADLNIVRGALLLLGTYVAGQIVATPAKAVLETLLVAHVLGRPNVNLLKGQKPRVRGFLFPGFYEPLPTSTRERVQAKARANDVPVEGEALFLHARYRPETRQDDKLMERLDAFLRQYGFSRNLSFTCMTAGIGLLARGVSGTSPFMASEAAAALVVGLALLYRYLKFLRQYCYELFNAFAATP